MIGGFLSFSPPALSLPHYQCEDGKRMDPGSVFIASVFFHGMLPCSPKRMRDGGASEPWKGEWTEKERGIMYPRFVAFTSEVKSANVYACTLRTWRAGEGRTHFADRSLNSISSMSAERNQSINEERGGHLYRGRGAHHSPTHTAAPQFGQSLTASVNWCVPVNQLTAQHRLSLTDNATGNRPQPEVPQFAALHYCFNKPWNEVPPLQRKQELQQEAPIHLVWCKKNWLEGWKMSWKKKVEGVDSSHSRSTSMWNLLGQMTRSPTAALHFSVPSQCFHQKKKKSGVGGLWNMLTQANERAGNRGGEVQTDE